MRDFWTRSDKIKYDLYVECDEKNNAVNVLYEGNSLNEFH